MQVDDILLNKLEKLAMLKVQDDKKEEIKQQLGEIVNFVENLNSLNTDDLEANFTILESKTPLRVDEPHCDASIPESVLKHAPKSEEGYFIVPKIIG